MIYCVIGAPGAGKTTFIKSMIKGRQKHTLAFDPNLEYNGVNRVFDKELLIVVALNNRNKIVVFEEATTLFHTVTSVQMRGLLARHRHLNHEIYLVFHDVAFIPYDIIPLCSYFIVFAFNGKKNSEKLPKYHYIILDPQQFLKRYSFS